MERRRDPAVGVPDRLPSGDVPPSGDSVIAPVRLAAGFLLVVALASPTRSQTGGGYGAYTDWEGWARVVPGERGGLASSWDRSGGSVDANRYEWPTGLILDDRDTIAATIEGPGILWRFWMPHRTAAESFALRLYFDGESVPRIDTDSAQLLDGHFGYLADPLVTTVAGGQVCYEPIPFRDSVRIETENFANAWHWYQYGYRTFAPGTDVTSWTGTLDVDAEAARAATAAMFANAGQHPAGPSATALESSTGPTVVPPGLGLTAADLPGPGLVRRLDVRMDGADDASLDSLVLRVTWDDRPQPAIDAPVGAFFGAGHGRAPYRSVPLGTDGPNGFYCYWPMPFRESARFELVNTSAAPVSVDSVVVAWEPGPVAPDLAYLHAAARRTVIAPGHDGHVLLSAAGTGHYVGNLLYAQQEHATHFFLEGDDIVVVDGETTLNGTGLEDAYNGGHYYNWNNDPMDEPEGPSPASAIRPLSGILRVELTEAPELARADQYRWMIADRVPFTSSLDVRVETAGYAWAPGEFASVAFWYRLPPTATGLRAPGPGPALSLEAAAPNPSSGTTLVRFTLPDAARVVLEVLDVRGRRVGTLVDGRRVAGPHRVRWTPDGAPSGVYFLRLSAGTRKETRKIVLVR